MNDFHPRACEERVYLNPRQTLAIYLSQSGLCLYCPEQLWPDNLSVEHVIPRYWGGPPTAIWNIGLACKTCNDLKGPLEGGANVPDLGMTPEERLQVIVQKMTEEAKHSEKVKRMIEEIRRRTKLAHRYRHVYMPEELAQLAPASLGSQTLAEE